MSHIILNSIAIIHIIHDMQSYYFATFTPYKSIPIPRGYDRTTQLDWVGARTNIDRW